MSVVTQVRANCNRTAQVGSDRKRAGRTQTLLSQESEKDLLQRQDTHICTLKNGGTSLPSQMETETTPIQPLRDIPRFEPWLGATPNASSEGATLQNPAVDWLISPGSSLIEDFQYDLSMGEVGELGGEHPIFPSDEPAILGPTALESDTATTEMRARACSRHGQVGRAQLARKVPPRSHAHSHSALEGSVQRCVEGGIRGVH